MQTGHSYIPQGRIRSYRFGMNGMEKDNEVYGEGNSYTAEYWQYDSRLGRRWNRDVVIKSWRSPYDAFSNSPIRKVDPSGDDDFYNEKGQLVYSTATGNKLYIAKQTDYDVVINSWNTALETGDYKEYVQARDNLIQEKIVEIKNNVTDQTVTDFFNKSFVSGFSQKEAAHYKEQNALIVLNVEYDEKGGIKAASLNLEVQSDQGNTIKRSSRTYGTTKEGVGISISSGGTIVGGLHSHPAAAVGEVEGVQYSNEPSKQKVDIGNFTRGDQPQIFPEFTIDVGNVDYTVPNSIPSQPPTNFVNDYLTTSGDDKSQIATKALKLYGEQHKGASKIKQP